MAVGRVAVVGAGVVGACIAYYLAREGVDVLLIDAGRPGEQTTSASLAWVNASTKAADEDYFQLCSAGLREYDSLVANFGGAGWWNPTGHLRWDFGSERELTASVARLQALEYPVEIWEGARVQTLLEPNVAMPSPSTRVVRFPTEAWVDGPEMVRALVSSAVNRGAVTAFGNAIRRIDSAEGSVTSIELAGGEEYVVETVVNAAGPGATTVAALVGRALPMKIKPGLAVRVETTRDLVASVVHAPDISFRPDGDGRLFLSAPSLESALDSGDPSLMLAEEVKRIAARAVPDLVDAHVREVRIGRRPIPADGFPVIGKPTGMDRYYEAVTHSGITLGPIIARAVTAEILHGAIDPLVSRFRASRFG